MNNPYRSPAASSAHAADKRQLALKHHVARNLVSWAICLVLYCVFDYFYVTHGAASVRWAEALFLPCFLIAMIFANRGLFQHVSSAATRWFAICAVSLAVVICSGYFLITCGIWFHFAIGGQL